jgi:hypothetical protein
MRRTPSQKLSEDIDRQLTCISVSQYPFRSRRQGDLLPVRLPGRFFSPPRPMGGASRLQSCLQCSIRRAAAAATRGDVLGYAVVRADVFSPVVTRLPMSRRDPHIWIRTTVLANPESRPPKNRLMKVVPKPRSDDTTT